MSDKVTTGREYAAALESNNTVLEKKLMMEVLLDIRELLRESVGMDRTVQMDVSAPVLMESLTKKAERVAESAADFQMELDPDSFAD